jgi:hypothetical protein
VERVGPAMFFFHQAYDRIHQLNSFFGGRFKELFDGDEGSKRKIEHVDARVIIQREIDRQEREYKSLARFDLKKESEFKQISIYEYFFHLEAIKLFSKGENKSKINYYI